MVLIAAPMAGSSGGSGITLLLPLVLIVGMIWFMSRSQRKQRQKQAETVAALVPGTRVVTTSGQLGTVEEVDDEYVTLEIADGVLVQFVKQAIGRVLPDEVYTDEDEELTDDELEDLVDDDSDELDETDEPTRTTDEPARTTGTTATGTTATGTTATGTTATGTTGVGTTAGGTTLNPSTGAEIDDAADGRDPVDERQTVTGRKVDDRSALPPTHTEN